MLGFTDLRGPRVCRRSTPVLFISTCLFFFFFFGSGCFFLFFFCFFLGGGEWGGGGGYTTIYCECSVLHHYLCMPIGCNGILSSKSDFRFACTLVPRQYDEITLHHVGCTDFKTAYELLNLRASKFSVLHVCHMLLNAWECHLKIHTNRLTSILKNVCFIQKR